MLTARTAIVRAAVYAAVGVIALSAPAVAATETVIYSFGAPGTSAPNTPLGQVILDASGNIYGTTEYGGANKQGRDYQGTIFEVAPTGQFTVLKNLMGKNEFPQGGLTRDKLGNIYGTTFGVPNNFYPGGSLFKLGHNGGFQSEILPSLDSTGPQGIQSSLTIGSDGNLYGTSYAGGQDHLGTAFRVLPDGTISVLHSFSYASDGAHPSIGSLVFDAQGNMYGATGDGGPAYDGGIIYTLTPDGTETILYDGYELSGYSYSCSTPNSGFAFDPVGNIYGTTKYGGDPYGGCIFQLTPSGSFNILYVFPLPTEAQASVPNGGLLRDAAGDLFGTTQSGGDYFQGSVFEFTASGTFKTLYSFTGGADGGMPTQGLASDGKGNFYGATSKGGAFGGGVIFGVKP